MVVPFTIWMLRGFVASVPIELEEAAMVDGCTRLGAFRRITFPLIAPGLVASGSVRFHPGLERVRTRVGPADGRRGTDAARSGCETSPSNRTWARPEWGQIMAGSVLVAVPVIIFFMIVQGRMAHGLVGGAVKG